MPERGLVFFENPERIVVGLVERNHHIDFVKQIAESLDVLKGFGQIGHTVPHTSPHNTLGCLFVNHFRNSMSNTFYMVVGPYMVVGAIVFGRVL